MAKLVPIESASSELLGARAGMLKIEGDILSTGVSWNADLDTHILLHALAGTAKPAERLPEC